MRNYPIDMNKFLKYCESKGLELLPDDISFLKLKTKYMRESKIRPVLSKYVIIWIDEMAKERIEHRKQNVGRFAANSWLRDLFH